MSKPEDRLARLLDTAQLSRIVPRLPAETLHQLIQYRGLDACGDILAAATREQVSSLADVDLWRKAAPAADEQFDAHRFGEWIETLVDMGEGVAARIVAGLDRRLVAAGLSRHIRVLDPAACARPLSTDDEQTQESAAFAGLGADVGGYLVRARRTEAWDAIVELLLSLEADHRECFDAVMRGCRRLSSSVPEADGFHDLLTEPEQLLHDLGLARQSRRSGQGYLGAADARLVLQLARQGGPDARDSAAAIRRIAADYLREDDQAAATPDAGHEREGDDAAVCADGTTADAPAEPDIDDSIEAVVELLAEAGFVPERPRALLAGQAGQPSRVEQMQALLERSRADDGHVFAARSRELAFLANALMAGCSIDARPFTVQEASDAAVAVCNLGLEERETATHDDLIDAFQAGWRALHEMSLSAVDRFVAVLDELRYADLETQMGLHILRRELARQRQAGTPWRARDALDVVATLDMPAWVSLLGVLDECPVLPAALRATLERRTGAINAKEFEFISTRRQIDEVRAFMDRLRDVLIG
jgi:hypothetical protein